MRIVQERPVRAAMIKLTETREITPYAWLHPDEERHGHNRKPQSRPKRP
jgi:hypothetical protein